MGLLLVYQGCVYPRGRTGPVFHQEAPIARIGHVEYVLDGGSVLLELQYINKVSVFVYLPNRVWAETRKHKQEVWIGKMGERHLHALPERSKDEKILIEHLNGLIDHATNDHDQKNARALLSHLHDRRVPWPPLSIWAFSTFDEVLDFRSVPTPPDGKWHVPLANNRGMLKEPRQKDKVN